MAGNGPGRRLGMNLPAYELELVIDQFEVLFFLIYGLDLFKSLV